MLYQTKYIYNFILSLHIQPPIHVRGAFCLQINRSGPEPDPRLHPGSRYIFLHCMHRGNITFAFTILLGLYSDTRVGNRIYIYHQLCRSSRSGDIQRSCSQSLDTVKDTLNSLFLSSLCCPPHLARTSRRMQVFCAVKQPCSSR